MFAQRAGVELQHRHRFVYGRLGRARDGSDLVLVVGQRRALDGIAVVHQQRIGKFLARGADQRGGPFEAIGGIVGQLEVVVAAQVEMQVGGGQQGKVRDGALDRKSVVSGKSVSVRVDIGGRRVINIKTKETNEKRRDT